MAGLRRALCVPLGILALFHRANSQSPILPWGSTASDDISDEAEWKVLDATADRLEEELEDSDDPLEKYSMALSGSENPVDAAIHAREVLTQEVEVSKQDLPAAYRTCKQLGQPWSRCQRGLKLRAHLRSVQASVQQISKMMPEAATIDQELQESNKGFSTSLAEEQDAQLALKQEAANDKELWKRMDAEHRHSVKYAKRQLWLRGHLKGLEDSVIATSQKANLASDRAKSLDVQLRGILMGIKFGSRLDEKTAISARKALEKAKAKEVAASDMANRASALIRGTDAWLTTRNQINEATKLQVREEALRGGIQRGRVAQTLDRFGAKAGEEGTPIKPAQRSPQPKDDITPVRGGTSMQDSEPESKLVPMGRQTRAREVTLPKKRVKAMGATKDDEVDAVDDSDDMDAAIGTPDDPVVAQALGEDAARQSPHIPQEQTSGVPSSTSDAKTTEGAAQASFDSVGQDIEQPVLNTLGDVSVSSASRALVGVDGAVGNSTNTNGTFSGKVDALARKTMEELDALEREGADLSPWNASDIEDPFLDQPAARGQNMLLRGLASANMTNVSAGFDAPSVPVSPAGGARSPTASTRAPQGSPAWEDLSKQAHGEVDAAELTANATARLRSKVVSAVVPLDWKPEHAKRISPMPSNVTKPTTSEALDDPDVDPLAAALAPNRKITSSSKVAGASWGRARANLSAVDRDFVEDDHELRQKARDPASKSSAQR